MSFFGCLISTNTRTLYALNESWKQELDDG